MKEFIVEKNIPIPAPMKSSRWKQIVSKMEIGDSVLVETRNQAIALTIAARSLPTNRLYNHMKFVTRKTDGGVRVWRTA